MKIYTLAGVPYIPVVTAGGIVLRKAGRRHQVSPGQLELFDTQHQQGETRTNQAGHQEVLQEGRWHLANRTGQPQQQPTKNPATMRWHVTAAGDLIREKGFQVGLGGGAGGPLSGKGISVWKDKQKADQFHKQMQELEDIRSSGDPLKAAEAATNQPISLTDGMAGLWAGKLGRALDSRERAIIHAQSLLSPYIPPDSFFGDGPRRKFENLAVHVSSESQENSDGWVNDDEELHSPEKVKLAQPQQPTLTIEGLHALRQQVAQELASG